MRLGLSAGMIYSLASVAGASEFRLEMPLDCTLGDTCFIQQFTDRDPGPGAADFTCGPLVYDGHKGTDFALPSLAALENGVDVLAASTGIVGGVRDEMADILVGQPGAPDLDGRDCGNGLVINHGDGWETQYCHMRLGSLTVRAGERVEAGTVLGQVGLSGRTDFPHLHLSVRKNGAVIDPFAPEGIDGCQIASGDALWADDIAYTPGGWVSVGFSPDVPDFDVIKAGTAEVTLAGNPGAMVLWGYGFGIQRGDTVLIEIDGPSGPFHQARLPLERTQAQMFRASGKRRPKAGWEPGVYIGRITLLRDGAVISMREIAATLP
jgi:hypothetical protein